MKTETLNKRLVYCTLNSLYLIVFFKIQFKQIINDNNNNFFRLNFKSEQIIHIKATTINVILNVTF